MEFAFCWICSKNIPTLAKSNPTPNIYYFINPIAEYAGIRRNQSRIKFDRFNWEINYFIGHNFIVHFVRLCSVWLRICWDNRLFVAWRPRYFINDEYYQNVTKNKSKLEYNSIYSSIKFESKRIKYRCFKQSRFLFNTFEFTEFLLFEWLLWPQYAKHAKTYSHNKIFAIEIPLTYRANHKLNFSCEQRLTKWELKKKTWTFENIHIFYLWVAQI